MTNQSRFANSRLFAESFKRLLPNPQAVSLAIILVVSFVLIYSLSTILMPVFASIVLAYLLDGLVGKSIRCGLTRLPSVYLIFSGFMACLTFLLFYLMPLVSQQAIELIQNLPRIISSAQRDIMRLPELYPTFISENKIQQMISVVQQELLTYAQNVV